MTTRRRRYGAAVLAAALLAVAGSGCGTGQEKSQDSGGSTSDKGPIVIGAAIAKTGILAAYDVEPTQALELRVAELNAAGGIDGRKLVVKSADTRSDLSRGAVVADDLISQGARILAVTCDFDYGSPAAIAAARRNVPAIALCASDPKFSDKTAIGPTAFTMGTGTDAKAALIAEYAYGKLGWRTAYVLQDTSLEYTKSLGRYFDARWRELGGKIVGSDRYQGSQNVNVRAQITKLQNTSPAPDFIYLPGWGGGGEATVIKQLRSSGIDLPTFSAAAVDGAALVETAGNVSGVWYTPFGCFNYCSGDDSAKGKLDAEFAAKFEDRYGKPPTTSYAENGYDMGTMIAAALKPDPNESGDDLVAALEQAKPTGTLTDAVFTAECHKPSSRPMDIVEIENVNFVF
jgi:branched-chain amino acid transport system substrate-binding protein